MLNRRHYVALSLVAALALVLLNLPAQTASRLKLAVGSVFLPLFGLAGSAQKVGESAGMRILPKGTLIKEIETLRRQNEELKLDLMQAREMFRENGLLRQAVGWQQNSPWKLRLARVVTRDPANWWRTLQIDVGRRDGIVKNLPVITSEGLVGRVDAVGEHFSRVLLVGDPNCKVPAIIENEARDTGVIMPGESSVLDESIVEITYLSRHSKIQPGQRVATSGLGGVFPKGIPIGHVLDTASVGFGLYLEARVKLTADLRELEHVYVIMP